MMQPPSLIGVSRTSPGTINSLVGAYCNSSGFRLLGTTTQVREQQLANPSDRVASWTLNPLKY